MPIKNAPKQDYLSMCRSIDRRRELINLLTQFESESGDRHSYRRESKLSWLSLNIYRDEAVNNLFLAFLANDQKSKAITPEQRAGHLKFFRDGVIELKGLVEDLSGDRPGIALMRLSARTSHRAYRWLNRLIFWDGELKYTLILDENNEFESGMVEILLGHHYYVSKLAEDPEKNLLHHLTRFIWTGYKRSAMIREFMIGMGEVSSNKPLDNKNTTRLFFEPLGDAGDGLTRYRVLSKLNLRKWQEPGFIQRAIVRRFGQYKSYKGFANAPSAYIY
jgi:hypothetical protein